MVLVGHFFNVALHGVKHALAGLPTPQRFRRAYDLLHVACCIIMPMIVSVSRHPSLCPPLSLCENRARVRVGVRVCTRVCTCVCAASLTARVPAPLCGAGALAGDVINSGGSCVQPPLPLAREDCRLIVSHNAVLTQPPCIVTK